MLYATRRNGITLRNGIGTLITLTVAASLAVVWNILAGRLLGPEGLGILAVATLYPILLATVGHMTFGVATVYDIGRDQNNADKFAANSLLMALVVGLALYAVSVTTIPILEHLLYNNVPAIYLRISFAAIVFHLVTYQMMSVLQGTNHIKEYNIAGVSRFGVAVVLLPVLVVLMRHGVLGAIIAFTTSFAVSAVVSTILVSTVVGLRRWRPDIQALMHTLRASSLLHIASVATVIYGQAGIVVANYYLTTSDVGYLFVALVCVQLLAIIPQAAQVVLYPSVAGASSPDDAIRTCTLVSRHTFAWSLSASVVLGIASYYLIDLLLGSDYRSSLLPLWMLLPGVVLSSVPQTLSALWIQRRWYWFMAASGTAIAVTGVVLQIVLTSRYGVAGSAAASSLTYLVGFMIAATVYRMSTGEPLRELFLLKHSDVTMYKRALSL